MSRRPPARLAVTTPLSPGFAAIATLTGRSVGAVRGAVATVRAGAGRVGAGLGGADGDAAGGAAGFGADFGPGGGEGGRDPGGFGPGWEGGAGTGRLPVSGMEQSGVSAYLNQ
jgi:hypothetical protein